MGDQLRLAVIAIGLGVVASILLAVPFVAISYRRRGGLTAGRVLAWSAALVYFWALAALVAALATRHGRGPPGLAMNADLADDREQR